jgi:hypothetical protein
MTGEVKRDNINKRFTLSTLPLPYSHGKRGQMAIQRRHRGGRVNSHFLLPAQNRRKLNCSVHIIETQSLNRDYHHHQHFHPPPSSPLPCLSSSSSPFRAEEGDPGAEW